MDRRIQKTRHAIMDAFMEILIEQKFDKITINEIADKANVNRGTVYLHYADKYDLLDKCIEFHIEKLLQQCRLSDTADQAPASEAIYRTFEYLKQNYNLYALLLTDEGVSFFRSRFFNTIKHSIIQQFNMDKAEMNIATEITVQFLTSAGVGIFEWWIINAMPCGVDEVTNQLIALIESNIIHLTPKNNV